MLMKSIAFVLITVAWRSRENEAIEKASIILPIKSTCMKGKPLESQLVVHPINDATQFFRHESYLTRIHPLHRTPQEENPKKSSWNFLDTLFTEMFSTNFQPSVLTNLQHPASIKPNDISFAKLMIEKSIHENCVVRLLKLQVINGRVGWADWILDILFFVICSLYSLL